MITDWLMVGITLVYVIATCIICKANITSAKATKEELAEIKRQFDESKRLEYMPFFQLNVATSESPRAEILLDHSEGVTEYIYQVVALKNVGNSTATTIIYDWTFQEKTQSDVFPINAIMRGDTYYFQLTIGSNTQKNDIMNDCIGLLLLQFNDILGHTYTQKMFVHFDGQQIKSIENDDPVCQGIVGYSIKTK